MTDSEIRDKLRALDAELSFEEDQSLSPWELNFIESIFNMPNEKRLSERQRNKCLEVIEKLEKVDDHDGGQKPSQKSPKI